MAIRVLSAGGRELFFDTVDELLEYERKADAKPQLREKATLDVNAHNEPARSGIEPTRSTKESAGWIRFVSAVSGKDPRKVRQRKVIALIKGRGQAGIPIDEIAKAIGDDTNSATSGTISGIIRNTKKAALQVGSVIQKGKEDGLWRPGPQLHAHEPPEP